MTENSTRSDDPSGPAYDAWLRDKVAKARLDPRPSIPHEEVMAKLAMKIQAIADTNAKK